METAAPSELQSHLRTSHLDVTNKTDIRLIVASAVQEKPVSIDHEECPLCRSIPGKSKGNVVIRLARHIESIALAVLPCEAEEDSDQESIASGSTVNEASSAPQSAQEDLKASTSFKFKEEKLTTINSDECID